VDLDSQGEEGLLDRAEELPGLLGVLAAEGVVDPIGGPQPGATWTGTLSTAWAPSWRNTLVSSGQRSSAAVSAISWRLPFSNASTQGPRRAVSGPPA
jgi:hypothetical protein